MSTTSIEKHVLEELYYKKKLTKSEIAKRLGVDRSTVLRACSIYKLENIEKKLILERLQKEFHQVDSKLTVISYTNTASPVTILCSCGQEFTRRLKHMRKSKQYHCHSCIKAKKPRKHLHAHTFESIQKIIIANNPEAELVHFSLTTKPLTIICSCGNMFSSTYKRVKDTKTCLCPSCTPPHGKQLRLSLNTVHSFLEKHGCKLASRFETSKKTIAVICSCGQEFETTFLEFKRKVFKACPDCTEEESILARRTSFDEVHERLKERGVTWLSGEYHHKDSKLLVSCSSCDTPYSASLHSVYQGNRVLCSSCTKSKSRFEHLFEEYVNELNIPYLYNRSQEGATSASGAKLRFDFILYPEQDKPIMIEIDGDQHFKHRTSTHFHRTNEDYLTQKKNDHLKEIYCQERGIPLIRISYRMINSNKQFDLLKSNLSPLLLQKSPCSSPILFFSPLNANVQIEDYPTNHLSA